MTVSEWRSELLRKKIGHAGRRLDKAVTTKSGTVYASPNSSRLYVMISETEENDNSETEHKEEVSL
ncbi:Uncharacterised protein [Vibrio cholerae]|nr:Uncharacterised protein [Vibrio cholerae]